MSPQKLEANIKARNAAVSDGKSYDYPADDGLLNKLNTLFEVPAKENMDIWYMNE